MLRVFTFILYFACSFGFRGIYPRRSHSHIRSSLVDSIKADVEGKIYTREVILTFLELVEKDKEFLAKVMESLVADKDDLKQEIAKKDAEILRVRSEKAAITSMRAILEAMLKLWRPNASHTAAYKELSKLMLDDKGDLTKECSDDLKKLEGETVKAIHVASEIKDLYHELSKIVHYPQIDDTGMIVGGNLPLRAAVGMAFLMLQRQCDEAKLFVIVYADENYKKTNYLQSGSVRPVDLD